MPLRCSRNPHSVWAAPDDGTELAQSCRKFTIAVLFFSYQNERKMATPLGGTQGSRNRGTGRDLRTNGRVSVSTTLVICSCHSLAQAARTPIYGSSARASASVPGAAI